MLPLVNKIYRSIRYIIILFIAYSIAAGINSADEDCAREDLCEI